MSIKIGVLLPQSSAYPTMGKAFINGLKLGLGADVELVIESIGMGTDAEALLKVGQKMIYQYDVDFITGLLGHHGLPEFIDFVSANEIPLIYADFGAHAPTPARDYVFVNSLGLYESTQTIGDYFSDHNMTNVATSTCYYEAGYGFIEGLERRFECHSNTKFAGHFITPLNPREQEIDIMNDWMNAVEPDAIFAFHSGEFAKEYASYLSVNKLYERFPIYALPFSANDESVSEHPEVFEHLNIISTWFPELNTDANQYFVSLYEEKFGKQPNFFALLGHENGLVIAQGLLNRLEKNNINLAMKQVLVSGPRGEIKFNKNHHSTSYKQHLWRAQKASNDNGILRVHCGALPQNSYSSSPTEMSSNIGWFNTYLCH